MAEPEQTETAEWIARRIIDVWWRTATGGREALVPYIAEAIQSERASADRRVEEALERAAKTAERIFGGRAHTYASENADLYRAQDAAAERIASAIRSLIPKAIPHPLQGEGNG